MLLLASFDVVELTPLFGAARGKTSLLASSGKIAAPQRRMPLVSQSTHANGANSSRAEQPRAAEQRLHPDTISLLPLSLPFFSSLSSPARTCVCFVLTTVIRFSRR
jgi:hypothetical protein